MNDTRQSSALGGPGIMILSAAVFAFFGFYYQWSTRDASGQIVPVWFLLTWSVRGTAIAFGASAVLTFVHRWAGNLLYCATGIVSALLFVAVIVMDHLDKQHAAAISPILLVIFAAWNGYGAWTGLVAVLATRPKTGTEHTFQPPDG